MWWSVAWEEMGVRGEGWYAMGGVGGVEVFPVHQGQGCTKVFAQYQGHTKVKVKVSAGGGEGCLPMGVYPSMH